MTEPLDNHHAHIVDQFTRQAIGFADKHRNQEAVLEMTVRFSEVSSEDNVLDVACGPGIVSCAFAQIAKHVTVIDMTPAMLDKARQIQAAQALDNLTWQLGNVESMPFEDRSFTMIVTRYSLHHMVDPSRVLHEMLRVCSPGGTIVVIDSAPESDKADAFNRMEMIRDPSHTRAMPPEELGSLMSRVGLRVIKQHLYQWEVEAERQIATSFPNEGGRERLRAIFEHDVKENALGMNTHRRDGRIFVSYPTLILVCKAGRQKNSFAKP